ncbi:MAG: hypothetical protein KKH25_00445, partial [Candidatus Omnitrophica bacterium]|nr:hypothetical protein [Candidatus Omnitrophota bacterium]
RFAILEDKHHKDRHLMNKYRLGVAGPVTNSNGKPFDLFKPVSFETDSAGRLKEPKHLDDFLDFVQYKVEIHNGTIEAEGLTVEAKEELYFDYQEILKVIAELEKNVGQKVFSRQELTNLKKVLDKYSATALRVYGISAFTVTKVNGPDKEARKGGVSVVQEIKYLGQKPVIIFKSKGLVKDETDKLFLGTDEKLVYSDIEGNYFIIKEQRSVTYVYGFDRYGRGLLSLRVVPYQEGKKLTEVDPTAKKLINNVSLYKGLHTLTQNLAFIKFEGEILAEDVSGREVVLGENVEDNYRQLQGKQLRARLIVEGGRKYSSLQNLLIELKDGQGLTRIRLANTDLDLTQLMYGQISLQNWAQTQGLDQQVDHMNEIIFLDYLPEDTKKIYVSLVASRIAHESWSHQVRRDSKGQIIFEEAAYLSERNPSNSLWGWLLRKKKFRYLDHTYNPRFIKGSILLEYQVDTNRPGRSDGTVVTTLSGTIVREIIPHTTVRAMLGKLGNAYKGEDTIHYDALGLPIEISDSLGRIIKRFIGIWFFPHFLGGFGTRIVSRDLRPLGPKQSDLVEMVLHNGNFKSERRLGVKELWAAELRGGWLLLIIPFVILGVLLLIGKIFDILRTNSKTKSLIRRIKQSQRKVAAEPLAVSKEKIIEPSYQAYGFKDEVVRSAKYRFRGELNGEVLGGAVTSRLARGEPLIKVISEYLESYQVWLKNYPGKQPLKLEDMSQEELAETLWIVFLVISGSIYAHNDTPSYLSYLIDKALAEKANNPDNIGSMIRAHVERWWTINYWTSTSFKSFGKEGGAANTLPFQYLFTVEDLEEIFRTPKFVAFYEGLGDQGRDKLYENYLIPAIIKHAKVLKEEAKKLGPRYNNDRLRMKKALVKT